MSTVEYLSISSNRFKILEPESEIEKIKEELQRKQISYLDHDNTIIVSDKDCDTVDGILYEKGVVYTQN